MTIEQVAILLVGLVGGSLVKVFFDVIQARYSAHLEQVDKLKTLTAVQQQQLVDINDRRDAARQENASSAVEAASDMHRALDTINRSISELLRDVGALRAEISEFRGRQITHMNSTDARLEALERRLERVEQSARMAP